MDSDADFEVEKPKKVKPKKTKSDNPTKQILSDAVEKQVGELIEYSFDRIKHPEVEFITADSLRKALYAYDVKAVDDATLQQMMTMAKQ